MPSLGFRDAVSTHAIETIRALNQAGSRAALWAEDIHPEQARRARLYPGYEELRSSRKGTNLLFHHLSTGSRGLVDFLLERPERRLVYYHNITPSSFFEPYDPGAALNLARGREELKAEAGRCELALANSEFSAMELRELGVSDVRVCYPYLPPALDVAPNPAQASWLRRTKKGADLLFVSRVTPHKGHINLFRAFAALRAAGDHDARLFIVGAWGPEEYMHTLFRVRERLSLEGVVFTGSISEPHLAAYYAHCDVYVSMSEHEGFGLPLVEAMRAGLPVVAYDSAAVAETLGGAGVLVRDPDPAFVAEVVLRVASDSQLRKSLIEGQNRRVAEIEAVDRDRLMLDAVAAAAAR